LLPVVEFELSPVFGTGWVECAGPRRNPNSWSCSGAFTPPGLAEPVGRRLEEGGVRCEDTGCPSRACRVEHCCTCPRGRCRQRAPLAPREASDWIGDPAQSAYPGAPFTTASDLHRALRALSQRAFEEDRRRRGVKTVCLGSQRRRLHQPGFAFDRQQSRQQSQGRGFASACIEEVAQ
jgi:hypothetical protein